MKTASGDMDAAAARAARSVLASDGLLSVRRENHSLVIATGDALLRRQRLTVRTLGAVGAVAVLVTVQFTPFAFVLFVAGVAVAVLVPGLYRHTKLLDMDLADGCIRTLQASGGRAIPTAAIRSIEGRYETQDWEGRSVIYAVNDTGTETSVLILPGTDERLAECACCVVGRLLDLPATYSGPFGTVKVCNDPPREEAG
jgi:hypothetical protein